MDAWYGQESRQKWIRRADAFAGARDAHSNAEETLAKLEAIVANADEGPLARANALGYLGTRYANDARVFRILESAMDDQETLVRSIAARFLNQWPAYRSETIAAFTKALHDPSRAVQIEAAVGLVSLGVRDVAWRRSRPIPVGAGVIPRPDEFELRRC
jgi:hypothetical protein